MVLSKNFKTFCALSMNKMELCFLKTAFDKMYFFSISWFENLPKKVIHGIKAGLERQEGQ